MSFNSTSSNTNKRKFFKLFEISGVFKYSMIPVNTTKNETVFTGEIYDYILNNSNNPYGVSDVDNDTIFFITASENDEGKFIKCRYRLNPNNQNPDNPNNSDDYKFIKINKGDTLLWVKGDFYALSKIGITNIIKEDGNLSIIYSNGAIKNIALSEINGDYKSKYPISISNKGIISLEDIQLDKTTGNYIEFPKNNEVQNGVLGAHVQGYGNIAACDYQTIVGKYAKQSNNSLFIVGNGEDNLHRKTLLSVSNEGITYSEKDVIAKNIYKLSDIHSVKNEDWAFINTSSNTGGFDLSFSTSFDLNEFE